MDRSASAHDNTAETSGHRQSVALRTAVGDQIDRLFGTDQIGQGDVGAHGRRHCRIPDFLPHREFRQFRRFDPGNASVRFLHENPSL